MSRTTSSATPKVGIVSLGCPKALVDSERILTQLRAEGVYLPWLDTARAAVLALAFAASLALAAARLARERVPPVRAALAWMALAVPLALVGAAWGQQLFRA